MRVAVSIVVLCGCRQLYGLHDPDLASVQPDAVIDTPSIDASDASAQQLCVLRSDLALTACVPPPTLPFAVTTSYTFNTDDTAMCAAQYDAWCVVALQSLSVQAGATARVTGSRPLVVLVRDAIEIDGTIDVSSHIADHTIGAGAVGATLTGCNAGNGVATGGGGGGSFLSEGGRGGHGNPNSDAGGVQGTGLSAAFHAGCPGGTNGSGSKTLGGGAIAIVSKSSIAFSAAAKVMANGAGGAGGLPAHGGYGGGAGGAIVLDAPAITSASGAQVFANGGSGGGGGSLSNTTGGDGGESTTYNVPGAIGAQAGTNAGNGGSGYPSMFSVGGDSQGTALPGPGAGGGGGGGGYIVVYSGGAAPAIHYSPDAITRAY